MISKEEFIRKCDDLIPKEEIEKYNECRRKMWKTLLITLVVEALIAWGVYFIWEPVIYIAPVVALISTIIVISTTKYKWSDFKKQYANGVMDILFEGYNYEFKPDMSIGQGIFRNSCFYSDYDSYSGEDLLSVNIPNDDGTPSGVKLSLCDLHVTKEETRTVTERDANGRMVTRTETYTVTIFNGVFGYIYFPFEFKCNLGINVSRGGLKKIKLEDVKFNKKCKTYTDNQLEALVILTPTLMNKLKGFSERIKGFKIYITKSGCMYLAMSRNMFELSRTRRKPSGIVFEKFYNDVNDILLFVNEIKNNNKVFKM